MLSVVAPFFWSLKHSGHKQSYSPKPLKQLLVRLVNNRGRVSIAVCPLQLLCDVIDFQTGRFHYEHLRLEHPGSNVCMKTINSG